MQLVADEIEKVRADLKTLEDALVCWESDAQSQRGSNKYRAIASQIVHAAQHLEGVVKQHTFSK
jgi:hypothetical protein